ncbi:intraflagellar transport protein 81 [Tribonema minus]|uniref:Intraflagellar transport protein 81 n=1 Tax=Tribonema minus TaxID=303371 RepID=A0A836CMZ3_9STRA|nr:intraflagellar transport protein 81 [Tribonema minus]
MAEISYIVERLNEPPFKKDLRLVDFDEQSPAELLQTLNDVFATIDPQHAPPPPRDEPEDVRAQRIMAFLQMLKFEVGQDQADYLAAGLGSGSRGAVYPVLHWALQRLPQLQKRAYLARFLMPVDVPADFMQDAALQDMQAAYADLQADFKVTHKAVDALRRTDLRPTELRAEVAQLEEERRQLGEKIARARRAADGEPGFEEMLAVTGRLRGAQEEEARLAERAREQRALLQQADQHLAEGQRRLQTLRAMSASARSADAVLAQLRGEVGALAARAAAAAPEAAALRRELARAERDAAEPARSREDVAELRALAAALAAEAAAARAAADDAHTARGDANLSMFRQQAALAAQKLEEKESAFELLAAERAKLARQLEDAEAAASSAGARSGGGGGGSGGGGGGFMTREEFKAYGARLREKTQTYKRLKAELAELRAESVVLARTEQVLRSRDDRLEELLQKLEADKGVSGYRRAHAELVAKSEQTAAVDANKAETLEEISALVVEITHELKSRKERLRPLIENLKDARHESQDVEAEYARRRNAYDKVAVGLEVERSQLEQECDALQTEALQEESRFHFLAALTGVAEARLARIEQERKWQGGEGRLLPDFKCLKDLYENKLRQQEGLSKALRRQQRTIRETEGASALQRRMYGDLQALLRCKLALRRRAAAEGGGGGGGGALGSDEAYLKAMDAQVR